MSAYQLATIFLNRCRSRGIRLATAESCTGGQIAGTLTEVAGVSDVFECGFVTYSNESKSKMLGVSKEFLRKFGAVSQEVAVSMAEGAVARSLANMAVSVTGIAGPGGGNEAKPVGLVHMAIALEGVETSHFRDVFPGDRVEIRRAVVESALTRMSSLISE